MNIHPAAQGTQAWLELRSGVPTASELGNLLTDKFEIRKGQMPATYLATKLAEKWLGGPLPGFGSFATEQGSMLEDQAIPWLEFDKGIKVDRVGFLTTDDGLFGCSPDGLIDTRRLKRIRSGEYLDEGEHYQVGVEQGLEVKCLQPVNHVKALMGGVVPEEFLPQIHGGLYVTGFDSWRFLAYNRSFPPLWLTVERDEEIQEKIAEALALFLAKLQSGWERLVEMNGGELPPKREPMVFAHEYRSEFPS